MNIRLLLTILCIPGVLISQQLTWEHCPLPPRYYDHQSHQQYAVTQGQNGRLILSTLFGIFISDDQAETWIPTAYNPGSNFVVTLSGNCVSSFRVSYDNGSTWSEYTRTSIPSSERYKSASILPDRTIIYQTENTMYRSSDVGGTWTEMPLTGFIGRPSSICVIDNGTLFATSDSYPILFRSTDKGDSWVRLDTLMPSMTKLHDIFSRDGKDIIVVTANEGMYRSTNNGNTWTSFLSYPSFQSQKVTLLWYAVNENGDAVLRYRDSDTKTVLSTDGGTTWSNISFPSFWSPSKPNFVFTGNTLVIPGPFISTDLGATWERKSNGLLYPTVQTLTVDNTGRLYAGIMEGFMNTNGIFVSTDKGSTFTPVLGNSSALYSAFGRVFDGYRYTTDFGATWSAPDGYGSWKGSFFTGSDGTMYAYSRFGGISRSTDSGTTWTSATLGLEGIRAFGGIWEKQGMLYFTTSSGIYSSSNQGKFWVQYTDTPQIFIVRQYQDVLCGVGEDGVYFSTDNGLTWENRNSELYVRIVGGYMLEERVYDVVVNQQGCFYFGVNGGVWSTNTFGNSWAIENRGLTILPGNTDIKVHALAVDSTGVLYAGVTNEGIFRTAQTTTSVERSEYIPQVSQPAITSVYPNPVSGAASVTYELSSETHVTLALYDMLGRTIRTVASGVQQNGIHTTLMHTDGLASGTYRLILRSAKGTTSTLVAVRN